MNKTIFFVAVAILLAYRSSASDIISASRNDAVLIIAQLPPNTTETGSGFFLDQTHVVTCFHVVGYPQASTTPGVAAIMVANDIKVVLSDGEVIQAQPVPIPTGAGATILQKDFIVLKLKTVPKMHIKACPLAKEVSKQAIGSTVTFSGYPLIESAPSYKSGDYTSSFLHTFIGTLSGVSKDGAIIGMQAPVNHGSSGSAVLDGKGEVIGIVTYEHSTFDAAYKDALNQNIGADQMSPPEIKFVTLVLKLIQQLGQTDSNGIGYARSVTALRAYIEKYPEALKN